MKRIKINPGRAAASLCIYILLAVVTVITLFPVLYSICGSFKETQELMVSGSLIPEKFTFNNYKVAWEQINYARYTLNSVIVAAASVLLSVANTAMTAYVLSRRKFAGKKIVSTMYMASMFISIGPASLYPTYSVLVGTGLNRSLAGLVVVGAMAGAANIFLTRGYVEGISKDFDDAAKIDGCSFFRIFAGIILPMMKPIIAVVALLVFRGSWNSYLLPMIVTSGRSELMTLPVATVMLKSGGGMATNWSVLLAAANISLVPMIIIYIICNKQMINGLTVGGLKG